MTVEATLFLIIGSIAVFSAAMMLLSEKPVHSALFLIMNFLCVAVFYIMLDAPFLAMIQIAVYAGAIMVLFLFVIMLLDADLAGTEDNTINQRGISFFALVLAVVFVLAMSFAFLRGDIDNREIPEEQPQVRVLNFSPDLGQADFSLNDEVIAENLGFEVAPDANFVSVASGDVSLSAHSSFGEISLGDYTLEAGHAYSFVIQGIDPDLTDEEAPELTATLVEIDLSHFENSNQARLVVFNALSTTGAVAIGEINNDGTLTDDEPEIVVDSVAVGTASDAVIVEEGTQHWGLISVTTAESQADGEEEATIITSNSLVLSINEYETEAGTSQLLILGERRLSSDDSLLPVIVPVDVDADFAFGSPQLIGESLFIKYVLPFEMVAILLLAAMVGAIVLAQRGDIKPKPGRPIRRKVSRPLTAVIASQTGSNVMRSIPELEQQADANGEDDESEADEQTDPTGD